MPDHWLQAVLLSLAHKLVSELPSGIGPLTPADHARLHWFTLCVQQLDSSDPATGTYVARIVELSTNALMQSASAAIMLDDIDACHSTTSAATTPRYARACCHPGRYAVGTVHTALIGEMHYD
jgi:hypothetical protein